MQTFSTSPKAMLKSLTDHRALIYQMSKREVIGRYKGSVFGLLWSFLNPVFMLCVYTFVFSIVFKARWHGGSGSRTEFALILFAGMIVFNLFSECFNKAPSLILSNPNYVKKVVFPLEVLPWVSLGSALFHFFISLCVWVIFYLALFGIPHLTVLLIPLVVLPLVMFIMGLSWALGSLGVYLRDVSQFVGIVSTVLMFISPIFYPASAIPERYRYFLLLNPLGPALEQVREVLFWGKIPDISSYLIYLVSVTLIAWIGFAWFQKTRRGFADVL